MLPGTDIVLVAGGLLDTVAPSPPFNSSDVCGRRTDWAVVVGMYDHSVVLCGGELNGSYSNAV